jgi:hypothetical protein
MLSQSIYIVTKKGLHSTEVPSDSVAIASVDKPGISISSCKTRWLFVWMVEDRRVW